MAEEEEKKPEANPLGKVESLAKKQPWYVWLGVAIGGLLVGYTVLKARATASSSTAGSTTAGTQASSLNGYDVSGMAGIPYAQEPGQLNNYPDPGISGTTPPATTSTPTTESGIVRALRKGDPWDASHTGVPIRASADAGSTIAGYIPWGSTITVTGTPLSGPTAPGGSSIWYKVSYNGQTGYLSGFDLPSVFQSVGGQGSGGDFLTEVNNHRLTVDRRAGWHDLQTGSEQ